MQGTLIALEGIDGTGKSLLAHQLAAHMEKNGMPCVAFESLPEAASLLTQEQKAWARTAPIEASFMLYIASIAHKSTVLQQLLTSQSVVVDRYTHSVLAHHFALGLPGWWTNVIEKMTYRRANYSFCVQLPEEIRQQRLCARGEANPYDLMDADDESTPLGKKRIWLSRLVPIHISNAGSVDETVASIIQVMG